LKFGTWTSEFYCNMPDYKLTCYKPAVFRFGKNTTTPLADSNFAPTTLPYRQRMVRWKRAHRLQSRNLVHAGCITIPQLICTNYLNCWTPCLIQRKEIHFSVQIHAFLVQCVLKWTYESCILCSVPILTDCTYGKKIFYDYAIFVLWHVLYPKG
jgi:hypothetical protein